MYAIWCGIFYYLYIYLLNPKNAGEWEKTSLIFFVALGFLAGTIIGCTAGLLKISRVNTALLSCSFTSAFVLLLISDDLAHMDVSSFRTLASASVLFHVIIGALIGLLCYDIRDRFAPAKLRKKKRATTEIINLNPASAIPHRLPKKINFTKAFELQNQAPAPAVTAPALMTSLVLEAPAADTHIERGLKINYRLLESFPNPLVLQNLHTGMLPSPHRTAKMNELPSIPMPKRIPGLATV